jgi:hypothetical protein
MDEAAASNAKPFDAETGTPRARITDKNHNHARVLLREFGTGTFTSISDQSYSSRLPQAKASAECSIKNLSAAPGSTFRPPALLPSLGRRGLLSSAELGQVVRYRKRGP